MSIDNERKIITTRHMKTPQKPTAIDLFAGVGGMSLGFEQAGFDVRAAYELEKRHVETYNANRITERPIAHVANLAETDAANLLRIAGVRKESVDVVFGGPPCQGFSYGGVHSKNDPRNLLVNHYARLIQGIRPRSFVMENVAGLCSEKNKCILFGMIDEMRRAGYKVAEPQILNAKDFGVPQTRERVFVIGTRNDVSDPIYPNPHSARYTVFDALADLPDIDQNPVYFDTDVYEGKLGKSTLYSKTLRAKDEDNQRLTGCQLTRHAIKIRRRFEKTEPGTSEPVSRYHRLAWDGLSPTLRAGTGEDHGKHTAPRPIHPLRPRCITTREAARLHGYPDDFTFHRTKWHAFRQIGNSVPPPLARCVAEAVLAVLQKGSP